LLSVGIDIGGTFTDLFAIDHESREYYSAKSLTTPDDLSLGVFDCIDKAAIATAAIETLVHGSTLAINITIERKGARTALVVTRGTRDVYEIGRGNRPEAYNVFFERTKPLVPRRRIFEATERHAASGDVVVELTREHATEVARKLNRENVEAVAVCFLHSYAQPQHELLMGEVLRELMPTAHVSLSHEIVREYREYERTSTTVLNAYVGPRSAEYLGQLEAALASRDFHGTFLIMQSNGGVTAPETAKRIPVATMESGPVGGVIASAHFGGEIGYRDIITFDMGGTTAKTSLIQDASPTIAHGYYIGGLASGHPAMLPVVDIVEVGAGGGSIAWIDEVGALRVGPQSAGAAPGPICYGRGGVEPTVTDANVVLGRIGAAAFQGGEIALEVDAAQRGITEKIGSLGLDAPRLAAGIVRLAVSSMVLAVRSVSVERGFDPRDFVILAQGGNGPLHAVEVARELGVPVVIVPPLPGVFSAVGMLMADLRHDYVRTYYRTLGDADFRDIVVYFEELVEAGRATLSGEGVADHEMRFEYLLELRYLGQDFALAVPFTRAQIADGDSIVIRGAFDAAHQQRYGHAGPTEEVEIVNLRVVALGVRPKPDLQQSTAQAVAEPAGRRGVWFYDADGFIDCDVYTRSSLGTNTVVNGPALIEEHDSTTLLWPGDTARPGSRGELVIDVRAR
jgi:N-methylhydantoinase A